MLGNLVTEIRNFYSLKELSESVEDEINSYKAVVEEYSQRLGFFLRELETTHGDEDWFKEISALQKSSKKEKSKSKKKSSSWTTFKDIMLSTDNQGEAEMFFEAIEEINKKIMRLGKFRDTIEDLKKFGLGKDILYVTYVRDEIPEKLVLRKKREKAGEKFEFIAEFSTVQNV
jgi:uncharacterized protein YaaR (DUF327 family)